MCWFKGKACAAGIELMLPFETSAAAVRVTAEARVHLVAPAGLRLIRLICIHALQTANNEH